MNEDFKIYRAKSNDFHFKIEEDLPEVGWYLYVYKGDKCVADYIQTDLEKLVDFAREKYGVEKNEWN